MVYGLPTDGEANWGTKVNASIEAVKTTADAAETEIAGRLSEANLTASIAVGETVFVNSSGNDLASGRTPNAAKATLQAAHDALPAEGGAIVVPPGAVLTLTTATKATFTKPITLRGRGATIKAGEDGLHEWLTLGLGAGRSVVSGIDFDSASMGRTTIRVLADDVTIAACRFRDKLGRTVSADTAVKFNGAARGAVLYSRFENWGHSGASVADNNTSSRCVAFSDPDCSDGLVFGCTFDTVFRAVDIVGSGHKVDLNTLHNVLDNGIYCSASTTAGQFWRDITITRNFIDGVEEGIVLAGSAEDTTEWCERAIVSENVITGWTLAAINWAHRVRDLAITKNILTATGAPNIFIGLRSANQTTTALTHGLRIEGNKLRGSCAYAPIWVQNVGGASSIVSNDFDIDFTASGLRFIKADTAVDGLLVEGNNFYARSGTAVVSVWVSAATSSGCKLGPNNYRGVSTRFVYGSGHTAGEMAGWQYEPEQMRFHWAVEDGASSTSGSWSIGIVASRFGPARAISAGAQGNSWSIYDWMPAGTYTLTPMYGVGPDRGIATIYVDGVSIGTVDCYSASVSGMRTTINNVVIADSGKHTITFTMTDKNASSTGYIGELSAIAARRY